MKLIIIVILSILFLCYCYSQPPTTNPQKISATITLNPGLKIDFTTPDSTGGSETESFKFYYFFLCKSKNSISSCDDNRFKSGKNKVGVGTSLPEGVTIIKGKLNNVSTPVTIKFDKSLINTLVDKENYYVGIQIENTNNRLNEITWSDDPITYEKCSDDGDCIDLGQVPDGGRCCTTTCTDFPHCSTTYDESGNELVNKYDKNRYCESGKHVKCDDGKHYCGDSCVKDNVNVKDISVGYAWDGNASTSAATSSSSTTLETCKNTLTLPDNAWNFNLNETNPKYRCTHYTLTSDACSVPSKNVISDKGAISKRCDPTNSLCDMGSSGEGDDIIYDSCNGGKLRFYNNFQNLSGACRGKKKGDPCTYGENLQGTCGWFGGNCSKPSGEDGVYCIPPKLCNNLAALPNYGICMSTSEDDGKNIMGKACGTETGAVIDDLLLKTDNFSSSSQLWPGTGDMFKLKPGEYMESTRPDAPEDGKILGMYMTEDVLVAYRRNDDSSLFEPIWTYTNQYKDSNNGDWSMKIYRDDGRIRLDGKPTPDDENGNLFNGSQWNQDQTGTEPFRLAADNNCPYIFIRDKNGGKKNFIPKAASDAYCSSH